MKRHSSDARTPDDFVKAYDSSKKPEDEIDMEQVIEKLKKEQKPSTTENNRKPFNRINTVEQTQNESLEPKAVKRVNTIASSK